MARGPREVSAGVQQRGWTGLPATARSGKRSASGRAAGRLRGDGTKRGRPESCAVPAMRGRVTASLACQAARRRAAEISQQHSPFRSQPAVPPPPRRALTQSGTPAAAGFARNAAGLPHRHPRVAPGPAPGRRTPAPIEVPGGSAAGSGPEAQVGSGSGSAGERRAAATAPLAPRRHTQTLIYLFNIAG